MATTCEINGKKADIAYPIMWQYKVIVPFCENIDKIIKTILLEKEYKIEESNISKSKKYQSYNLTTLVINEKEREGIFEALKKNEKIKYVL